MAQTLIEEFKKLHPVTSVAQGFLSQLEGTIAQDLWKSAGGFWSESSIEKFRALAMQKLAALLKEDTFESYQAAWVEVVRDFHQNCWGESRLPKKEKKAQTEESRVFWELFSYIWVLLQAVFITKTAVFYFGIKSAQEEDSAEGKIYVLLAILFSFVSLIWFAYRKSKKHEHKD